MTLTSRAQPMLSCVVGGVGNNLFLLGTYIASRLLTSNFLFSFKSSFNCFLSREDTQRYRFSTTDLELAWAISKTSMGLQNFLTFVYSSPSSLRDSPALPPFKSYSAIPVYSQFRTRALHLSQHNVPASAFSPSPRVRMPLAFCPLSLHI